MSQGKSGMIGVFRLESQMLPGSGKFERTGLGSDREPKEASNTAFNFLKANSNRISGSISTTSVSYTHLDVYKRQMYPPCCNSWWKTIRC